MTTSRTVRTPAAVAAGLVTTAPDVEGDPLRWIWLALVSGLFFIRWWKPTEGTLLGDTLDIAVGWFLVLALAGWLGLRGTAWRIRWDALQWAVCLLAGGHVVSGLIVVATSGDRRAAVNLIWEWVSLGVAFPLLRSTLSKPEARREWTLIALAAVVTLSAYGLTQRHVFYPQMIAQYERVRNELDRLEQAAKSGDLSHLPRIQKLRSELLGNGLSAHMLSGSGRQMLEGRLKHSSETLGQFALANTFAGLLLVWWLLLVFQTFRQWHIRRASQTEAEPNSGTVVGLVALIVGTLLVGYCLLLTKSRTAYLGGMMGLFVWTLGSLWQMQVRTGASITVGTWRMLPASAPTLAASATTVIVAPVLSRRHLAIGAVCMLAAVGGLILIGGLTGGLDRQVLAQAQKSLQYRLEYWWSSLGVIREAPLLGVGPGQFRQHYLAYKLPRSSEEIADPHNLVLDVWANGGVLALAGLLGVVFVLGREVGRVLHRQQRRGSSGSSVSSPISETISLAPTVRESGTAPNPVQKIPRPASPERKGKGEADISTTALSGWAGPFRWGAVGGLLILWLLGGGLEFLLLYLLIVWCLLIGVCDKILPVAPVDPLCWAAMGLGLLTHLCGAGGIAMPAITQLLLVVALLATGDSAVGHGVRLPAWSNWGALFGGIGLFYGGYATAAQPANLSRSLWEQGDVAKLASQQERWYRQAALADPLSAEPWERLAEAAFVKWRTATEPDEQDFRRAVEFQRHAIDRNSHSFHTHRMLGLFFTEHARVSGQLEDKAQAVREMQIAVSRYPHQAELLAAAAAAYEVAGETNLARETARRAIDQDDINRQAGHTDKWLTETVREQMVQLSAKSQ